MAKQIDAVENKIDLAASQDMKEEFAFAEDDDALIASVAATASAMSDDEVQALLEEVGLDQAVLDILIRECVGVSVPNVSPDQFDRKTSSSEERVAAPQLARLVLKSRLRQEFLNPEPARQKLRRQYSTFPVRAESKMKNVVNNRIVRGGDMLKGRKPMSDPFACAADDSGGEEIASGVKRRRRTLKKLPMQIQNGPSLREGDRSS